MLRRKFVYMTGIHGPSGSSGAAGRERGVDIAPNGENAEDVEFSADRVPENTLPAEMVDPHDRAKAQEYIHGAYAAILSGNTSAFLMNIAMLRSMTYAYDVDYAEAVLEWFGEFERGINSIRASMQGFSTEKGDYKLTEAEYKVLEKAKELLEAVGYSLDDIEGGNIVQKLLDGYEKGEHVEISKKDANRVMQFMTQMENKILPSDSKQEVLAAQLESTNKKRDALYDSILPSASRNAYGQ